MARYVIVLTLVCVIAALILGTTYTVTKPLIAAQKDKEKQEALGNILPGADSYQTKALDEQEYYEGYKSGKLIGYGVPATGDGYAGPIQMLVGVDAKGTIIGVEVLSQDETPGLGARCIEIKRGEKQPWFLKQFNGKNAQDISLKNIDAITGSTITSEAIINGIKDSIADFFKKIKA